MDKDIIHRIKLLHIKLKRWENEGYDTEKLRKGLRLLRQQMNIITHIGTNHQGYDEYRYEMDGSMMIFIPAGEFLMGSPSGEGSGNEYPQHKVYLNEYYLDKYEVTVKQFRQFCNATGHKMPLQPSWNKDDHPVVNVNWHDAAAYAEWAGKSLPTEAQWEKAARGDFEGKKYPWGNSISHDNANCDGIGGKDKWNKTSPVGSFSPNGYGLYDMAGNVWEWCSDWYDVYYYKNSPDSNPEGPSSGIYRVMRGGSWINVASSLQCAFRHWNGLSVTGPTLSFRCCLYPW